MTTSEPTTGEIARALRFCYESEEIECYECPCRVSGGAYLCHMDKLADRLESQEREIERLRGENKAMNDHVLVATGMAGNVLGYSPVTFCGIPIAEVVEKLQGIAALTARAEQAEKERDALVKSIDRLVEAWENFKSPALIELVKQWRGLPQDGEGL